MKLDWHKHYHAAFLEGVRDLTPEERGCYITVLDLIYDSGGPIHDNDALIAAHCNCSARKWRTIRDRLLTLGKLECDDRKIGNPRADFELESASAQRRVNVESGSSGGRASAESRKRLKENSENPKRPLEGRSTDRDIEGEREESPLIPPSVVVPLFASGDAPPRPPPKPDPASPSAPKPEPDGLTDDQRSAFHRWIDGYPRRVNRKAAVGEWAAALGRAPGDTLEAKVEVLTEGRDAYGRWCKKTGQPVEKIAHPANWLRDDRWQDDLGPAGAAPKPKATEATPEMLARWGGG